MDLPVAMHTQHQSAGLHCKRLGSKCFRLMHEQTTACYMYKGDREIYDDIFIGHPS